MSNTNSFLWLMKLALFIMTVLTANVYATFGQSYLLSIGQNSRGYIDQKLLRDHFEHNSTLKNHNTAGRSSEFFEDKNEQDNNSTIFVIKSKFDSQSSELSETAMDVITIVWYVATFLALAAFFLLMACSERSCCRLRNVAVARRNEQLIAPPTPSPSYSEFAPPSYESVMKIQGSPGIFVIPFPLEDNKDDINSGTNDNHITTATAAATTTSVVTFYTINELHKLAS